MIETAPVSEHRSDNSVEDKAFAGYLAADMIARSTIGASLIVMFFGHGFKGSDTRSMMDGLRESLGPGPFEVAHQVGLAALAGAMKKYDEAYDRYISHIALDFPDAKNLKKMANEVFHELRQIEFHAADRRGVVHSPARLTAAMKQIAKAYPDIFSEEDGFDPLFRRVCAVRDAIAKKFPSVVDKKKAYIAEVGDLLNEPKTQI